MKAVWYQRTGAAPDVLTFGDLPTPMAGPGEVRVRLEASGVNPADVGRRAGSYRAMEFPRVIPNSDGRHRRPGRRRRHAASHRPAGLAL
jgi:NADPH2:quinone reductase